MAQVNGDSSPSSAFLSHLYSYPVINDSITTFKQNPYGARSLDLTTTTYEKLSKPILPYLSTPYAYVHPYISKADSVADSTLSSLDSRFPAVKKPTGELYDSGRSIVFFPLRKTSEGKDYVFTTYDKQVKQAGGEGLLAYGKAAVGTGIIVAADSVSWLASFITQKKEQGKEVVNEKLNK